MMTPKVGGKVITPNGSGVIKAIHNAADLYPGDKTYAEGEQIYQVEMDSETIKQSGKKVKRVRNFRAKQLQ